MDLDSTVYKLSNQLGRVAESADKSVGSTEGRSSPKKVKDIHLMDRLKEKDMYVLTSAERKMIISRAETNDVSSLNSSDKDNETALRPQVRITSRRLLLCTHLTRLWIFLCYSEMNDRNV